MDATEVVCVIDKSGSMHKLRDDAIGGFNSFLEDQQKSDDKINLTTVLFDTEYTVWETKPVKEHGKLDTSNYVPGGNTALLDAVGRSINELRARLEKLDEDKRPDKAIFVIITDGQENSSREFREPGMIKKMIEEREKEANWQFIFVGANVDAFAEAGSMGIRSAMAASYSPDSAGTRSAYKGVSKAVRSYASSGQVGKDWKKGVH